MPKPALKTTLYRLIEAGHLARQQVLGVLYALGLEAGDDAVLFALDDPRGITETELSAILGLNDVALEMRLIRLNDLGLIERLAVGPQLAPGLRLTQKGRDTANNILNVWHKLEDTLMGELKHKHKKRLRNWLKGIVEKLQD